MGFTIGMISMRNYCLNITFRIKREYSLDLTAKSAFHSVSREQNAIITPKY